MVHVDNHLFYCRHGFLFPRIIVIIVINILNLCHVHQSVTETQTKIWQTKRFGRIQNYTEMTKEINSLLTLSCGCHQEQESLQPPTFHLLMLLGNFFPEMKQSQCWKHRNVANYLPLCKGSGKPSAS